MRFGPSDEDESVDPDFTVNLSLSLYLYNSLKETDGLYFSRAAETYATIYLQEGFGNYYWLNFWCKPTSISSSDGETIFSILNEVFFFNKYCFFIRMIR